MTQAWSEIFTAFGFMVLATTISAIVLLPFPTGAYSAVKLLTNAVSTPYYKNVNLSSETAHSPKEQYLSVDVASDYPEAWWTSPQVFELEKRAIFSKTWLHACHRSTFINSGDYHTFEIAGFSFIVVLSKDQKIRAFHNVCRHRAYDICSRKRGNSAVFRCRYHGWTYDNRGRLVKAPQFEKVAGFDKTKNGLFEVRNWIDSSGFIYVNFDVYGSDGLTIRVGVPLRARLTLLETWTVKAEFNWKIAMTSGSFQIPSLATKALVPRRLSDWLTRSQSWKWPAEFQLSALTRLIRSSNGEAYLTISTSPTSSRMCDIVCSLFIAESLVIKHFAVADVKRDVNDSVFKLRTYFNGVKDSGVIPDTASQEPLLVEITAHSRLETAVGSKVWPASRMPESSEACRIASDICEELDAIAEQCPSKSRSADLVW